MNQDTLKQLTDSLKPLADKIGQGAAHLYEVYVRQMVAEGVAGVGIGFVLLALGTASLVMFLKVFLNLDQWQEEGRYRSSLKEEAGYRMCAFGIMSAVLLAVGFAITYSSSLKIINPEYAAIQSLIETVRGDSR